MTATLNDIIQWYDEAVKQGCTHLIVAVDRFDYENYPIYVMPQNNVRDMLPKGNMQGYDEVYAMHLPKNMQLAERRAIHLEYPNG